MKICPKCLGRYDDEQLEHCPEDGTALRHIHTEGSADDKLLGRALDGRWLVEEKIGEGGMGAVYRGEQTSVGRKVAIKTLRGALASTEEYVERFLREANLASTLNHPNCVTIYDFGQDRDDHVLYLAMEFLEGRSLNAVLANQAVTLREALTIGIQICSALAAAHGGRIVHRDLKPDNIFLVQVPGDEIFIKVLDFGIAKDLGADAEGGSVTRTGQIFGTPAYMSPEQCQSADVDPRSDLYSLGVILYELVSGRPPFSSDTPLKTLLAHVSREVPPPSKTGITVPAGVEAIIMRLLEKDPDDRFQEALDVRAALEAELAALSEVELDKTPSKPDLSAAQAEADAQGRTLLFEEAMADGGSPVVDLEDVQTAITEDSLAAATAQEAEAADKPPVDDTRADKPQSSKLSLVLGLVTMVAAAAAAYIFLLRPAPTPPPAAAAQPSEAAEAAPQADESTSADESSDSDAPTSAAVPAVIELSGVRLGEAVAAGRRAQHTRGEELRAAKSKAKKASARAKKRPEAKEEAKKDPNAALLPVLTQEGARRVISSHNGEVTSCFKRGLLHDPDFGGKLQLRLVVAGDGSVANADIRASTIEAADVKSCIVERAKAWTFPPTQSGDPEILTTPFEFHAP